MREQGFKPKYPVIIIPGFVTSALQLWSGEECAKKFFRQRVWGSMQMTQAFFHDRNCWFRHMRLDEETGGDPGDVKVRAAEGLEAVDYFFPGYHVWAKLIESLADLGYDANTMTGVTYDWRLSVPMLEQRDGYFTKLKATIEIMCKLQNQKVLVLAHSWGDNVFRNFLHWADDQEAGWTEKHVAHYANMAGPVLGVPKAVTAMLSGEMRDTAELGMLAGAMANHWIPRPTRANLFRTWGSLHGMLPVGGPAIWGNGTWAPDDDDLRVLCSPHPADNMGDEPINLSIDDAMSAMLEVVSEPIRRNAEHWSAVHASKGSQSGAKADPTQDFLNPLKDPWPKAPSMRIYCMYGVGSAAERNYHYHHLDSTKVGRWATLLLQDKGVQNSDGDGTVPIISTGLMCYKGWRNNKKLNPASIPIVSREYLHQPSKSYLDLRGGPKSSEHVDILANVEVMEDVLRIAVGHGEDMEDQVISRVPEIAANVHCFD
eukprot:jgi/Astpho2/2292/e_gw1.00040.193.1_t